MVRFVESVAAVLYVTMCHHQMTATTKLVSYKANLFMGRRRNRPLNYARMATLISMLRLVLCHAGCNLV